METAFLPTYTDQLGRTLALPRRPMRIVSLCPSITETLYALGAGDRVVGRTRFCIHPRAAVGGAVRVGGTKEIRYDRLAALTPDLIIAEKEENTPEMVARLAQDYPVYVADVRDVPSALAMIRDLGQLLGAEVPAHRLADRIEQGFAALTAGPPRRVAYLIWRAPWMGVGGDTYIHDLLRRLGWTNVLLSLPGRYPVFSLEELVAAAPELVLLSSEPFPFDASHRAELAAHLPGAEVRLVDGEMFSWYGSRMEAALPYLRGLLSP